MHKITVVLGLLILCSCEHFEQDKEVAVAQAKKDAKMVENNVSEKIVRVADNVRDSIKRTNNKIREWWITPLPSPKKHAMPTRYCYRVLQDILCYRQQMPGWENKLVGYQGHDAVPPTPTVTKLIPLRAEDPDTLPENRAAAAKPVFGAMPVAEDKTQDSEKTATSGETLPESVFSPQL